MHEIVINKRKKFNEKIEESINKLKEDKLKYEQALKLKKEEKYDEIYLLYGRKIYTHFTPEKYMKNDIMNLLELGRFEDIYQKYGPDVYGRYLPKMQAIDIYLETGKKYKGVIGKLKKQIKKKVLPIFISGVTFLEAFPVVIAATCDDLIKENASTYSEEISQYDRKIEDYAKIINNLNLNDLQVIMKVMDDMWNNIAGYGNPKKDVVGFERLDFLDDNGIGVCRNMADDVCAKLNAINSSYNARTLAVKQESNDQSVELANIQRKILEHNTSNSNENQNNNNFYDETLKNLVGNHKVVMVDIENDNITLIVDPTNPSIGLFKNGEIYMFSTEDGKLLTVPLLATSLGGFSFMIDYNNASFSNYFNNDIDINVLREKYGVNAQNEALEYIRNIDNKINKENNNYQVNTFQNDYQYDYENEKGKLR